VAMVSQFPNYAKDVLGANNQVVTFFLTVNAVGVGAGSMLAGRLLHGKLTAKLVPVAAVIMALFAGDLWLVDGARTGPDLIDMAVFLAGFTHWRLSFDLFAIAVGAGLFVVPLYAIMQARSEVSHRARIVAANNVWNALFMVSSGLGSAVMLRLGASVTDIFLVVAATNVVVAAGTWRLRR
jgi:acyl-[acyl-carrier-protein]-phospholipid O-acyltransferase / long-chain-fatty-acid--[acyl-carrier-protein] ligase